VIFVTKRQGLFSLDGTKGSAALQTTNSISWYSLRNRVGWILCRRRSCSGAADGARTLARLPVGSRSTTIMRLYLI